MLPERREEPLLVQPGVNPLQLSRQPKAHLRKHRLHNDG